MSNVGMTFYLVSKASPHWKVGQITLCCCMCAYIDVCMHIHIYMYAYTYIYVCMHIHIYMCPSFICLNVHGRFHRLNLKRILYGRLGDFKKTSAYEQNKKTWIRQILKWSSLKLYRGKMDARATYVVG